MLLDSPPIKMASNFNFISEIPSLILNDDDDGMSKNCKSNGPIKFESPSDQYSSSSSSSPLPKTVSRLSRAGSGPAL